MAEQTKKKWTTIDTTSKISENPKKKNKIRRSNEGKQPKKESDRQQGHCLDSTKCSRNFRLPPLGAAKENRTEFFEITTYNATIYNFKRF